MSLSAGAVRGRSLPVAGAVVLLVAALAAAPSASARPLLPDAVPRQWTSERAGTAVAAVLADTALHQVYVVGRGGGDHSRDLSVLAYTSVGRVLWSATFSDGGYDEANAAVVDPVNHQLYLTGGTSVRDQDDYLTVAYGSDGRRLWARTWGGPAGSAGGSFDQAQGIAVDPTTHRVFVTGGGGSKNGRLSTIAYAADGTQVWEATYTGNAKEGASGLSVAVDPVSHDVVVGGGSSQAPGTVLCPVTVGYDADGHQRWVDAYTAPVPDRGEVFAVAVDPGTHAAYATGYSGDDIVTLGYDPAGRRTWTRASVGTRSSGWYLLVDPDTHQVFVVGQIDEPVTTVRGYLTIRYAPDGTVVWRRTYGATAVVATDSYPRAAALDPVTHAVYVTGGSESAGQGTDIATVAYDQDGGRLLAARYGGPGYESGAGIAVDPGRGVFVAGETQRARSTSWLTIAY